MEKCITQTIEELKEGNPSICLSPKRALNRCYLCKYYKTCDSRRVNKEKDDEINNLLRAEAHHRRELNKIKTKLREAMQ